MDITIGGMPFIKKDPPEEKIALRSTTKPFRRDQRKNIQDRRKSVRDGVFVSLSYKKDRRKQQDRRKSY
ncbi:MAG: hypothetical protein U9R43_11695 [Thermodesulfobacteriota bacterium]|nr:hypothetical protein [Thermodesulfobacteriota bacterium]